MDRRGFLCAGAMLALVGAGAAPAFAGGAEDSVMRQLKAQGYSQIRFSAPGWGGCGSRRSAARCSAKSCLIHAPGNCCAI